MSTPQQNSSDVAAAVRELDADVRRNIQARNADAMVDGYYADDARVLPPVGGVIQGKEAIREMWRALVREGMGDLVLETEILDTAGDLAFGIGVARATVRQQDAAPVVMEGRYTVAFRRGSDGTWRNFVDMYTIDSQRS